MQPMSREGEEVTPPSSLTGGQKANSTSKIKENITANQGSRFGILIDEASDLNEEPNQAIASINSGSSFGKQMVKGKETQTSAKPQGPSAGSVEKTINGLKKISIAVSNDELMQIFGY